MQPRPKRPMRASEIVGAIGGSEGAAVIINELWRFLKEGGTAIEISRTLIVAVTLPTKY